MKLRKRDILLIALALLPLFKLVHLEDSYCFGDTDLVIIGVFVVMFIIAFLVVLFFNLYKISILKELFNFTPVIIAGVYVAFLIFLLKYHDKNFFKDAKYSYEHIIDDQARSQLILYYEGDYQLKNHVFAKNCYQEGKYTIKKDTLYLSKENDVTFLKNFDSIYFIDKKNLTLNPKNTDALILRKIKKK